MAKTRAVASGEGGGGSGGKLSLDLVEPDKSSLDEFVFFRLSLIVCRFHGRDIGWSKVSENSKQNEEKPPVEIGVYMYYLRGSL